MLIKLSQRVESNETHNISFVEEKKKKKKTEVDEISYFELCYVEYLCIFRCTYNCSLDFQWC